MNVPGTPRSRLQILLWLVAIHSLIVGLGLILHPPALFHKTGYAAIHEPFFPVQGGIFHLIMATGYALGAGRPETQRPLIPFAILVKLIATVFLLAYWLLIDRIVVVLVSGLVDGAMALAIALAYSQWRREPEGGSAHG
jgi:hypothetical protein